ncbi:MAG: hypothetical protein ACTSSG_03685 [Candidatus Heimdallarchaeaceae archaeon]
MSRVNLDSAKNNIDRVLSTLEEVQQLFSSKKNEIYSKIKDLNEDLGEFFKQAEEKNKAIALEDDKKKENNQKLEQLNQRLQELTSKRDVLQSEISSKQKDIEQLSSIILEREKIFTEVSVQVDSLERRIAELKRKNEEIDVLSQAAIEEHKEELRTKEIKNAELLEQYERIVSRAKALQYLIKHDIINLPEIQVIRSLKTPGVNNAENLKKTSGVSEEIIRNILIDLDKREIISFDPYSGKFQLLSEIDI